MDTPERSKNNQIATSIGKFEDSPVFNFLNSLSPIKPVKSTHISQTINPLSFASLPSVFTSPHVTCVKETRFLRRHQLSDPSKPEFSSDDGNTANTNNKNLDIAMKFDEQKENLDPRVAGEPSYDCSKLLLEFAENFNCDNDSQNSRSRHNSCLSEKPVSEFACSSSSLGPLTYKSEGSLLGHVDQNKEASCDWDCLISDASDLLVFGSPNDANSYKKSVDPATSFYRNIKDAIHNQQSRHFGVESRPENMSTHPGELSEMIENATTHDTVACSLISNPSQEMDFEHLSGLCRGVRRRCLFEMGRNHVEDSSGSDSPILVESDDNTSSNHQAVPEKTRNDSDRLLPGIGLHLNALGTTTKDIKIINHESSSRVLLNGPGPSASFHPSNSCLEMLNNTLADYSLDREIDTLRNIVLPMDNSSREPGFIVNEEINISSPKKRKRRLDQGGEAESCKRCNCKKSKCLKLYCECFAAGVYCVEPCACIDCFNKPVHEDTVLATRKQIESRNPLAFAPKVIRGNDSISELGDEFTNTPASARHKRGCNCKKSGCLKKYCECYQGGVGCSINCRCEGCKNAFGRKDGERTIDNGSGLIGMDLEEDQTDTLLDRSLDSVPPATPLRTGRPSIRPFSSKKKPPRSSSFASLSSSSSFSTFEKANFLPPPPKFNQHFEAVKEDEMPEFLQGGSPISGVNSSSPNRKRVSPPQRLGTSSGLRSSRKLILQSIPSFPSLTHNQ